MRDGLAPPQVRLKPDATHWALLIPWAAAGVATIALLLLAGASRLDSRTPLGLSGSYFSYRDDPSAPKVTTTEMPSSAAIAAAWHDQAPDAFRVTWRGTIFVPNDGPYTFATRSDGESSLYLDARMLVENGGQPGEPLASTTTRPDRGSHTIVINYVHNGGRALFELLWARGSEALEPVPDWALRPRRVDAWRVAVSHYLPHVLDAVEWIWVGTLVLAVAVTLTSRAIVLVGYLRRQDAFPWLWWILAGSIALNVTGSWWGIDGLWAGDELTPAGILGALSTHFSNGWYDRWPPGHFYVLTLSSLPTLLLYWLGRLNVYTGFWALSLMITYRGVSLVMAAGTIVTAFLVGRQAFGARAGLFAAAMCALVAPFLYYAKTANVDGPLLFWFGMSLVFYLRLLSRGSFADFLWFAATASFAICTKDQAYGLYALMPVVLFYERWKAGQPLIDLKIAAALVVGVLVFALSHNLLFNFGGFWQHIQFIAGKGNTDYRTFEPTLSGRLALLGLTLKLTWESWGWPFFVTCVAGMVLAWRTADLRRAAIRLLVPVLSYYVTFINVILYNYDRFLLPICFIMAVFGGLAFDRLTQAGERRPWRLAATAALFVYTLLYSGTVDVLMVRDSRYAVERWLAKEARRDDLIGVHVIPTYLPRLEGYRTAEVPTIDRLGADGPDYFILNVDYTRGEGIDKPSGRMIAALERHQVGYTLAFRARTESPWPWLPGAHPDLVGPRLDPIAYSFLRNVNPTIEVFRKQE